jgi:hypothetical protein
VGEVVGTTGAGDVGTGTAVVVVAVGGGLVTTTGAAVAVMVIDPDDAESAVLVAVKVNVPDPLRVPDRTPVVGSRLRPAGSGPAVTENVGGGDPEARKL